jgi:phospholipid N-methyltransferase
MRYLAECGSFFREYRRHGRSTGAVLPSSRFLGAALVSELRKPRSPARILEVGPGTGAVTRQIVRHLIAGDRLDVVEINAEFVALLERSFNEEWAFQFCRDQLHIIHRGIEEVEGHDVYDMIISALPLNSFPPQQVREIFKAYTRLLKPGGTLSYYEYVWIRQLTTPFVNHSERRRLGEVGDVVSRYIRSYQVRSQQVLINVPPAVVRHLALKPVDARGSPLTL